MRSRCALLLLLAAAAAGAAEQPEPAADSITATKKDLATVKALGAPVEGASALPSVDMKAISPGPGAARVDAPAALPADDEASLDPSKRKDKEGTGNWLVDAMDKKSGRERPGSGRDRPSRNELDLLRDGDRAAARGEADAQAPGEARDRQDPKEHSGPAYNPLGAFMSGWISARDRDLLLPAAKGEGFAAEDRGRAPFQELGAGQTEGPMEGVFSPIDTGGWGDAKAQLNPYLAALDLGPASPVKSFAGPEAPDSSQAAEHGLPSSFGAQPGTLDTSRSFIPDFAHPSDDDKYFKQMKRF